MAKTTDQTHILTADEIWAAKDIEERIVPIPQWPKADGSPGAVRIRTFSKKQADDMRKRATRTDRHTKLETVDNATLEALLFVEGMVEPSFALEDYERMQEKSAVAVGLVLRAIMDASGLSELAVAEADKSNGTRPDVTLRVLPGPRVEDDAGGTAAEDVGA